MSEVTSGFWVRTLPYKCRVARLVLVCTAHSIKREKIYQLTTKCTKLHKLYLMAVKYSKRSLNIPTFCIPRPSKIYPNWDFWLENTPSGNLGVVCASFYQESSVRVAKQEVALWRLWALEQDYLQRKPRVDSLNPLTSMLGGFIGRSPPGPAITDT
jgi:hypothetical protein